uniref:Uncharacterized protein n=1 Tax=Zea mays TaxID=4577 RepID=C0PLM0_MAIZE|nr:unknown [Zea mays]
MMSKRTETLAGFQSTYRHHSACRANSRALETVLLLLRQTQTARTKENHLLIGADRVKQLGRPLPDLHVLDLQPLPHPGELLPGGSVRPHQRLEHRCAQILLHLLQSPHVPLGPIDVLVLLEVAHQGLRHGGRRHPNPAAAVPLLHRAVRAPMGHLEIPRLEVMLHEDLPCLGVQPSAAHLGTLLHGDSFVKHALGNVRLDHSVCYPDVIFWMLRLEVLCCLVPGFLGARLIIRRVTWRFWICTRCIICPRALCVGLGWMDVSGFPLLKTGFGSRQVLQVGQNLNHVKVAHVCHSRVIPLQRSPDTVNFH